MSSQDTGTAPGTVGTPPSRPELHWDRLVIGLLLVAGGVAWLAAARGAPVPWRLAPALVVTVCGAGLLASLAGGRGRDGLVVLGALALLAAIAVEAGADRYLGPAGDRTVVPALDGGSETVRHSVGTLTVDVTAGPATPGRLEVHHGVGDVVVRVPTGGSVRVRSHVGAGTILVDGVAVAQGVDLSWTDPTVPGAASVVVVDQGVGEVEVQHVAS